MILDGFQTIYMKKRRKRMARIVWDRRENIRDAIPLIPPVVQKSTKDFRPPATIEDDFRRL